MLKKLMLTLLFLAPLPSLAVETYTPLLGMCRWKVDEIRYVRMPRNTYRAEYKLVFNGCTNHVEFGPFDGPFSVWVTQDQLDQVEVK